VDEHISDKRKNQELNKMSDYFLSFYSFMALDTGRECSADASVKMALVRTQVVF
jgi:hypothetical protein